MELVTFANFLMHFQKFQKSPGDAYHPETSLLTNGHLRLVYMYKASKRKKKEKRNACACTFAVPVHAYVCVCAHACACIVCVNQHLWNMFHGAWSVRKLYFSWNQPTSRFIHGNWISLEREWFPSVDTSGGGRGGGGGGGGWGRIEIKTDGTYPGGWNATSGIHL